MADSLPFFFIYFTTHFKDVLDRLSGNYCLSVIAGNFPLQMRVHHVLTQRT